MKRKLISEITEKEIDKEFCSSEPIKSDEELAKEIKKYFEKVNKERAQKEFEDRTRLHREAKEIIG